MHRRHLFTVSTTTTTERNDEMVEVVKVLRQKLPIQDRIMRMKILKNCFSGSELVEILIHHLDCGRKKAVEIGEEPGEKGILFTMSLEKMNLKMENTSIDSLNMSLFILVYNFRGSTNDNEPKDAAMLGQRLGKIMSALLESYASDDRHHLDYIGISNNEKFGDIQNLVQDLHQALKDGILRSNFEESSFFADETLPKRRQRLGDGFSEKLIR
ncbi:hypothetical protein HAX54_004462 [Datura stramonium]|uniref:DEP domain-containing protein n=1 Tax=Datura stramonium TaxID=4076 RepID=A0ABS8T8C0_DATST|nr:hypothetical protein [Datura stramonium]